MTAGLIHDGQNDHLRTPIPIGNGSAKAGDDNQHWELEIEITPTHPSSSYVYRFTESTTLSTSEILLRKSDGLIRFVSPVSGKYQINASIPDGKIILKMVKPKGIRAMDFHINGSFLNRASGGDNACDFDVWGVNSNNGWFVGEFHRATFTDFVTPSNNRNVSVADSTGGAGATRVVDTINAGGYFDGFSFPTDGSQWYFPTSSGESFELAPIHTVTDSYTSIASLKAAQNVSSIDSVQASNTQTESIVNLSPIGTIGSQQSSTTLAVDLSSGQGIDAVYSEQLSFTEIVSISVSGANNLTIQPISSIQASYSNIVEITNSLEFDSIYSSQYSITSIVDISTTQLIDVVSSSQNSFTSVEQLSIVNSDLTFDLDTDHIMIIKTSPSYSIKKTSVEYQVISTSPIYKFTE